MPTVQFVPLAPVGNKQHGQCITVHAEVAQLTWRLSFTLPAAAAAPSRAHQRDQGHFALRVPDEHDGVHIHLSIINMKSACRSPLPPAAGAPVGMNT